MSADYDLLRHLRDVMADYLKDHEEPSLALAQCVLNVLHDQGWGRVSDSAFADVEVCRRSIIAMAEAWKAGQGNKPFDSLLWSRWVTAGDTEVDARELEQADPLFKETAVSLNSAAEGQGGIGTIPENGS